MSDNESPDQSESKVDFETENEFVSQKMLMSQKFKEYEELKTEYEAYKINANEIENLLETELHECKGKLEKSEIDMKNLKIREDSLKNELTRLRQDFETAKKKVVSLESKNKEQEKNIEKLEDDKKEYETNTINSNQEYVAMSEKIKIITSEKEELHEKLTTTDNELISLKHKFDEELESLVVQVKNKEVNEIADKYEKKIENLTNQINDLQEKNKILNESIQENEKKNQGTEKNKEIMKNDGNNEETLEKKIEELTAKINDYKITNQELTEKTQQYEKRIEELSLKNPEEPPSKNPPNKQKDPSEKTQKYEKKIEELTKKLNSSQNKLKEIPEFEKKINELSKQLTTSNQLIFDLQQKKQELETEIIDLRKQIANTSGIAISEDIEILEDDLEKEYERKLKLYETTTEKKLNEKFSTDYEEKMRNLKEGYDNEISKMQEQLKNLEEEIENKAKLKISTEYEKKLLEIKNKYEVELGLLNEKIKENESSYEKNNENVVKNLKKTFKNEKKTLEEKIDKLSNEKNLLVQEKNAWDEILKKNSKLFEKIPSFFTSSFFIKSDTNISKEDLKDAKNQDNYLFLLNKGKQSSAYRVENNSLIVLKSKKEKIFKFKEIFISEDSIIEQLSKLVDLKNNDKPSNKNLILFFGPKKTKKKYFFIEVIEQLIINFLDAIRNKNFNGENSPNESKSLNYELKVNFEQYPPEPTSKDLNFTLNSQFYVSQMISHHQKLISSIENSFNKFKTSFMKRNYIGKNENAKKIRFFKMSFIKCSDSKFQEDTFYILTSNKKPTLPKNSKADILEDILTLPNIKIPEFEFFKESQKNIYYLLDGAKTTDFTILNNVQQKNSEEESENQIPQIGFSSEAKKDNDIEIIKKEKEVKETENITLKNEIQKISEERDDLKMEINELKGDNSRMQEEIQKLTIEYVEIQKFIENGREKKNVAPIKESQFSTKTKNKEKIVETTTKKSNDKNLQESKKYYTPRGNNQKKIVLPQNDDTKFKTSEKFGQKTRKNELEKINTPHDSQKRNLLVQNEEFTREKVRPLPLEKPQKSPERLKTPEKTVQNNIKKQDKEEENIISDENENSREASESEESMLKEENPRPFPGKFALKKFNSLIH